MLSAERAHAHTHKRYFFFIRRPILNRHDYHSRCPNRKCVNREIDSWLRGLKCNRMENGTMNKNELKNERTQKKGEKEAEKERCVRMWADKRHSHFDLSSALSAFYYAINDHALLKSCIYFVSVSLFMFFFYGKNYHWFCPLAVPSALFFSLFLVVFFLRFVFMKNFFTFWDYLFGRLVSRQQRIFKKKKLSTYTNSTCCRITFRITNVVESFKWNQ